MKILRYFFGLLFVISLFSCEKDTTKSDSDPINVLFSDANFEALIREAITIPDGDITNEDLLLLTELSGPERNISTISGIEYCLNLEHLDLSKNNISDIAKLSDLAKLKNIYLQNNFAIIDISALENLTSLENLFLTHNLIQDISPITGLNKLKF